MKTEPNLKAQNSSTLWLFFTFQIALLISFFFATYFDEVLSDYQSLLTVRVSGILIAPLVLYIVNGVLSSNFKSALVFWRYKNVLPGCRAFSLLGPKDFRVDMNKLTVIHGELPTAASEQNRLWYQIYRLNKDEPLILGSHRRFLLGRDIVGIAFLFLILSGIPFAIFGNKPFNILYLITLLVIYLVTMVVARNHGNRFVTNVLSIESTSI